MALHQRQVWEKTCAQTTESGSHPDRLTCQVSTHGPTQGKGPPEDLEVAGRDV